jgi:hypothetical protein
MLIGRTAEELSDGMTSYQFEVTYRWRGVFRSYGMRAAYLRQNGMRDPRARPSEEGSERLFLITDVPE